MASRKNLVLASLVSLVMVLSFGIGLVPMLTVSPDQSAKAAPGAVEVSISVDGVTPVGASYAIPVGGEQGFSALRLVGDSVESLAGGAVEWSLASDGSAKLVSAADAAVATVQALAPGEAGLYVRTADGLVAVVDLTFYDLKAVQVQGVSTVAVTSPLQNAQIVVQTGTVTPLTLTAETDNPSDVERVRYLADTLVAAENDYGTTPPYAVVIPDVLAMTNTTVTAEAFSIALQQYVSSTPVTFTVVEQDLDGLGGNDPNGIPDDPFGAGLLPGEEWTSDIDNGTYNRTVGMVPLDLPAKAVTLPADGVTVTLADPGDATRWVRVTAPAGLVQPGQEGLLLVAIADTTTGLLGATEAANLAPEPPTLVINGQYASVNVLIKEGATWSSLSDVTDNPVVIEMGGLGVVANQSATFAVHAATAVYENNDTQILVTQGGDWAKVSTGSFVALGEMSAELTTLGVVAPYDFPASPNILSITPSQVTNLGGVPVRIALDNVTDGEAVTVSIDGQTLSGAVDVYLGDLGVTVTAPLAATLAAPAASAAVYVSVDTVDDFDAVPGGLTYQGPEITSVNPGAGGPATSITIGGSGFQNAPGTVVTLGDVTLTVDSISSTEIVAHLGNNILPNSGPVDVRVTNANQYTSNTGSFTVTVSDPVLDSVIPNVVYANGQYTLNLQGQNFIVNAAKRQEASAAVYFTSGGTPDPANDTIAASINTLSAQSMTATTPDTLAPGTYNVYVATILYTADVKAITTQVSNVLPVEFVDPSAAQIVITNVNPNEGLLAGGTTVTIDALLAAQVAYVNYTKVFFGANEGVVQSVTTEQITVLTPAAALPGPVDVRVENSGLAAPGNFGIAVNGFTYVQPVLAVSPQSAYDVTGPEGGPIDLFTPASKDFVVTNSGTGTLNWTLAVVNANWITLSSPGSSLGAGAFTTVTVSVNDNALLLAQGNYTGTLTFDDGDNLTAPIEVAVNLAVGPPNDPILGVTPATDLTSSGNQGEFAFPFANIDYSVTNTGGGTLDWTVSANQAWVDVSLLGGSLTAGASDTVNVAINSVANGLTPGLYTATLTFSDGSTTVTRQVLLTVTQPVLSVQPQEGFASFGPEGGAFAPLNKTYTVSNSGNGTLTWDASLGVAPPDWVTLTKDANSATVAINANANSLAGSSAGTTYSATLEFTSNGGTTARTVSVTVYASPSISSVAPRNIAPPAGGLTVYLTGTNLLTSGGTTRVFFTNAAGVPDPNTDAQGTEVTVFSNTELSVVTPPHAEGTYDVYVQTSVSPAGDPITLNSNLIPFIFAAPTMLVSDVAPAAGPIEGGTPVTITGSNFPDVGAKSKLISATGTTLTLANAVYNIYGESSTIRVDLHLLRGAEADPLNGPAAITGSFLFEPTVLEFVGITRNLNLRNWYNKSIQFALDQYVAGKVNFVIADGTAEITTFDNQLENLPPDDPHDPNMQSNPFLMGFLTFRAVTAKAVATGDILTPVTISDLAMVDSDAVTFPDFDADDGSVKITTASAEIQIEDQTVNELAMTLDAALNLYRPEGSNLLTGPADIEIVIDYDEFKLVFLGVDPSAQLFDWYGKTITAEDLGNGTVRITISTPTKQGQEITSVNPLNPEEQLNPFPLGTLHFGKKDGVDDLNGVEPLVVTGLTMLDKNAAPFPGGSGVGEVGEITVALMPQVFFGANEGSASSSTATQIAATTPLGDRRGLVDVLVVDPNQPEPGNYGFKHNAYTYQQPELGVSPAEGVFFTGLHGSSVFSPTFASYQIYTIYEGTLIWTASADQTWVTLNPASGSVGFGPTPDEVQVSINAAVASLLDAGTYTAMITFASNGGPATRQVTLTISSLPPVLQVDPLTGVEFTGEPGGPITPASRAYNISNSGEGALNWTASVVENWLDLNPASGANAGTVTVTLNANALLLGEGDYFADITFNSDGGSTTRRVTLTLRTGGVPLMVVTPETGLDSSGPQGGPFAPSSLEYTVSNPGVGQLDYTAVADESWVTILHGPGSGSIPGGGSATETATIDATVAAALVASNDPFVSTLTFDDGPGKLAPITRAITLTVFKLTVTSPNGGEEVERGDVLPIEWTYKGPTSNNQVRIELLDASNNATFIANASNPQTTILNPSNTYDWTVPGDAALGRDFKIRVTATEDNRIVDTSDAAFSIIEPAFEVLHPSDGEIVTTGENFTVEWNYFELGEDTKANERVDIWLYEGDQPVRQIASNVLNPAFDESGESNTNVWNVPKAQGIGTNFRIVFRNSGGDTILGSTPIGAPFEIVKGKSIIDKIGGILAGLIAALIGLAGGGGDKGGGGGGPCFIATAAYGTPMAAQIDALREFRDMYMLSNPLGMAAADAYYHLSPAIADVVAKYPVIAALVRIALVPVILMAKLAVMMPIPSMALAAFGAVMLALRRLRRSRKA